ncbi:hypothetical protein CRYUN_Cryun07bG0093000 [Craigia yunnanensis]
MHQKRPRTPDHIETLTFPFSINPSKWFVLTIITIFFFLQAFLFLFSSSFPFSFAFYSKRFQSPKSHPSINISSSSSLDDPCQDGKVYVYDLPPIFNKKLVLDCDNLNPWTSLCGAVKNKGLGQKATELASILPKGLVSAWYWTDQFMLEVIFHNRVLKHKCRTLEPDSASAFYIPFYGGLAVGKYLWFNHSAKARDDDCERLLSFVQDQPYWKRSNGRDHFTTLGRITWDFRRPADNDWGSSFFNMPTMQNISRLLIEKSPWDYRDIGVPYPTGFHPRSDSDILQWQNYVRKQSRKTLFCFAGGTRQKIKNDFRGILLNHCHNESGSCRVIDCAGSRCTSSKGNVAVLKAFLDSDFCLQPRGDSYTRRSVFDCMVAGSIPVFFWKQTAYDQYEWFLSSEPESYSVFIDHEEVKKGTSIKRVLEKYGREEVRRMREKVIEYIPKLVYAKPQKGLESTKDAFDIALDGVLRRFKLQRN